MLSSLDEGDCQEGGQRVLGSLGDRGDYLRCRPLVALMLRMPLWAYLAKGLKPPKATTGSLIYSPFDSKVNASAPSFGSYAIALNTYSTAITGDRGLSYVGHSGTARSGYLGIARGLAHARATAGDYGLAIVDRDGQAFAGDCGLSRTDGPEGLASVGGRGVSWASGAGGCAYAGTAGVAIASPRGFAVAAEYGIAIADVGGKAKADQYGVLVIKYNPSPMNTHGENRVGLIEPLGPLKPDTWYRLDDEGNFVACDRFDHGMKYATRKMEISG